MAEDTVGDSLERLHIHEDECSEVKKDDDADAGSNRKEGAGEEPSKEDNESVPPETSSQTVSVSVSLTTTPSSNSKPTIICDAWYGFPKQKRPRKERINAVSRQLTNFLEWRQSSSSSCQVSLLGNGDDYYCQVSLLGNGDDVQAVHNRMSEHVAVGVGQKETTDDSLLTKTWEDDYYGIKYQSNIDMNEFLLKQQQQQKEQVVEDTEEVDTEEVVYLSPDASHTLSSTSPPPRIVIIGMLIDRRITTDRSRIRAEDTLKIKAVKLPLDELNVKELSSEEPLNVDTVMELMQRWWWNCDKLNKKQKQKQQQQSQSKESNNSSGKNATDESSEMMYKRCFLEAAAWAMKSQRERHPNRTVHMTK